MLLLLTKIDRLSVLLKVPCFKYSQFFHHTYFETHMCPNAIY